MESTDGAFPIYTGAWINWSHGKYEGATLTLTQRNGSLLTAFLAIFITYAGSQLWRILCLVLGLSLSAGGTPQDGIYNQRLAILRNAASASTALWSFIQVISSWRSRLSRPWTKIFPFIILCTLYWISLSAAGVLSSKISSVAGDEVLISSAGCGQPGGYYTRDDFRGPLGAQPFSQYMSSFHMDRLFLSRQYTPECYKETTDRQAGSSCDVLIKPKLDTKVDYNASCPIEQTKLCARENDNVFTEARINSHDDLGLNSSPSERLELVWTTHCAPLNVDGYAEPYNYSVPGYTQAYTRYNVGKKFLSNGTQQNYTLMGRIPNFQEWQAMGVSSWIKTPEVDVLSFHALNHSSTQSDWYPLRPLQLKESDLALIYLIHHGMLTTEPSEDPWYSAHQLVNTPFHDTTDTYAADEPISFLFCKEQFQICDSRSQCSNFTSLTDAYYEQTLSRKNSVFTRLFQAFAIHSMSQIPGWLGDASVEHFSGSIYNRIREDQWKKDVVFWKQQFLASLQGAMIDAAAGPRRFTDFWHVANTTEERQFCKMQKIRSLYHANFSIVWLSVILIFGCLAIVIQWVLELFITWLDKRGKRPGRRYGLIEWKAHETLQLQRLAHEAIGSGSFSHCADGVPVTLPGEKLAVFDTGDPMHPRLKLESGDELAEGAEEPEDAQTVVSHSDAVTTASDHGSRKPIADAHNYVGVVDDAEERHSVRSNSISASV